MQHRVQASCFGALAGCLMLGGSAQAATLTVPGQYPTIQAALNAAQPGDTVVVADGVYTGPGNKGLSIGPKAVALISAGGPKNCILDLQNSGVAFFLVSNEPPQALVQGFTIKNGNSSSGGAAFLHHSANLTFADCVFTANKGTYGGAVHIENTSEPRFIGCTFSDNAAQYGGAAFASDASEPTFVGCSFTGNTASADGGGIYLQTFVTSPRFESCSIAGNTALGMGGGVFVSAGKPQIVHCTMAANAAALGGGIAARGPSDAILRGSILWGDTAASGPEIALLDSTSQTGATLTVSHSDVQGGLAAASIDPLSMLGFGAGNVDADPVFADLSALDLRLRGGSPAIDAGDPAALADPANPYDLLGFGHERHDDGDFDGSERIDMGAVEFGGLLGHLAVPAGALAQLELWGPPSVAFAVYFGVPGTALDLGGIGTAFLAPSPLVPIAGGTLPPSGTTVAWSLSVPASAVGITASFQAVRLDPLGPHLTNLERTAVVPP